MRVLIAGCGYIGTALGLALAGRGETVWGLKRHPQHLPAGIIPFQADLSQPATLHDLPDNLDCIVYACAAQFHDEPAYHAAYVEGPRNLIEALVNQRQSPRRFVYTSSTGVYSETDGGIVTEQSETYPASPTAKILVEGEQTVLAGPFSPLVLRIAGIYGPERAGALRGVSDGAIKQGPDSYTNRIHRDDIVAAILHLLDLPAPHPIYNLADCDPALGSDVSAWLAQRLNLPFVPASAESIATRAGSKRVSNARLLESGYTFRHPTFREGLETLIAKLP